MTLILSCLTPDYVIQVSDRRLTLVGATTTVPARVHSDDTNKAILVEGRFVFGFTGLAHIGGQKSDEWFTQRLAQRPEISVSARLQWTARELTDEFRGVRLTQAQKRLAFVGAGWSAVSRENVIPTYVLITNFLDQQGKWMDEAKDVFEVRALFIPPRKQMILEHAGISVPDINWHPFVRCMRKLVRNGVKEDRLGLYMVNLLHLAARNDPSVGKKLMVCSIPKQAAIQTIQGGFSVFLASQPTAHTGTFLYVDLDTRTYERFGPIVVMGGSILSDIVVSDLTVQPANTN